MSSKILVEQIIEYIQGKNIENIVLLKNREVIQWLFNDLSFLPQIEEVNKGRHSLQKKALEDKWGQEILKVRRPDLKLDKQWTNKFGEHLCEELYILLGNIPKKPETKNSYAPDLEIDAAIIEAKTQTYFTKGTAGEKILGCPFKYSEVPDLYDKPLKIVCIGGAEKICKEQYGNLDGPKCSPQKKKFLEFFKINRIEYIAATDILKSFIE